MSEVAFYICLAFVEVYMVAVPLALIWRRKSVYIEKRDWKPLMILAVVNVYSSVGNMTGLAPLWGFEIERDCRMSTFSLSMAIFTFLAIYLMRCLSLFKLYYYNQTKTRGYKNLDGFEKTLLKGYLKRKGSQASMSSDSFVMDVKKTSGGWTRAIGIPVVILILGFLFGVAYGGFQCPNNLPIIFTVTTMYAIMTLSFFLILRKVKDPYYVKIEMLVSSVVFIILILISGAQFAMLGKKKNPTAAETALPGIHPLIIVLVSNTMSFLMPVILSFKKSLPTAKSQDIKGILKNKSEWNEFCKICADYFCLENALFLQNFEAVKLNPTKEGIDMIYNSFIVPGSSNEINIIGTLRQKIKLSIEGPVADVIVHFEQVEHDIVKILEENIMRYYLDSTAKS